jgi:hypothetical protein
MKHSGAYYRYGVCSRPAFENYKKCALNSQPQVIKFTSCFPMIGESFRVIQASLTTKTGHHDIAAIFRIRVVFPEVVFVSLYNMVFFLIWVDLSFLMKHSGANSFNLSIIFDWRIVV